MDSVLGVGPVVLVNGVNLRPSVKGSHGLVPDRLRAILEICIEVILLELGALLAVSNKHQTQQHDPPIAVNMIAIVMRVLGIESKVSSSPHVVVIFRVVCIESNLIV